MSDALVVDDDPVTRLVLTHMLRAQGWTAQAAADVPEATEYLRAFTYDLVIFDFLLPSGMGTQLLDVLEDSPTRFVLLTGSIEYSGVPVEASRKLSARLTKPVSSEALRDVLGRIFAEGSG